MSKPSPDNPHTVQGLAWSVSYWTGNTASGIEGADRATISMHGGYPAFELDLPANQGELDQFQSAFKIAFEAGKVERSNEFVRLLGVGR